jgi:Cd2+/Zn2+-exporting ATPase
MTGSPEGPGVAPLTSLRPSPWRTPFARNTYIAGAFWAVGVVVSWVTRSPDTLGVLHLRLDTVGLLYLASSVAGGLNFFRAGWRAARTLRLDMNFLMSVAIVAALGIGESFEASTIAFLFSAAELLERFAVDRGRRAIFRLLELAPDFADRVFADGRVEHMPTELLAVADVVRVRPGGRIPTDGRVVAGQSAVNESTITGESLPRLKKRGDVVYAGTLNTDGSLDISVTADARHSTLARIVEIVRAAELRRTPVEQFVQRFARVYTPIVAALALVVALGPPLFFGGAGLVWFVRGVTLLVIACPCALVIATPVTMVSALTSAARHGVLVKGGVHLEALAGVRALAIDKTGTLTSGQLAVTEYRHGGVGGPEALLSRIATLEARSEHPVAAAIVAYATASGARPVNEIESFTSRPGRGVEGRVSGVTLLVGTEELVGAAVANRWGPADPDSLRIYAVADNGGEAIFVLRDQLRPASAAFVRDLHAAGIRPIVMLTGDSPATAEAVGQAVGVDEVRSRLLPEDKVNAVRELRDRYGTVAMIGDGVNDAPALAESTVGLVMGAAGSPATIEAADIALMGDDLSTVPYAIALARQTHRTVRFNIGCAIGLKILLAVGAIAGMVSLAFAVLVGDMGATVLITLNALRLGWTRARASGS